MEALATYKKVFAIWRPFVKSNFSTRFPNGVMVKDNSFQYCLQKVKMEAAQQEGKDALAQRWKELSNLPVSQPQKPQPTFLEAVVAKAKALYLEARMRIEYGDPNRIHPTWGRKLKRWEYLWIGLKSLPFERQGEIIPCHSHLIGRPAMSDYAIAGYSDLSDTDPFAKNSHAPERTDAMPNVEEWLNKNRSFESYEGLQPNT